MKIKFCGAAQTVTGSCHLLTLDNGTKILLDCGLYQGHEDQMDDFNSNWFFEPSEIDYLILSHAHIDHCGRIPKFVKDGFRGQIFATHATYDLCALMLLDSAHIQEKDAQYEAKKLKRNVAPLYSIQDAKDCLNYFVGVSFNKWFKITNDISFVFNDAGHILGSATIALKIIENGKETIFGFSGDIGRPNRPILKDPEKMPLCDYLICESTYGGEKHKDNITTDDYFLKIINETCVERRGRVIIPAFSVGRTQEIVFTLDKLKGQGKIGEIPVFVDSPLAVNATEVFKLHPECYDNEMHEYLRKEGDPFGFNSLHYVSELEQSKELNEMDSPAIIISASGMAQAGRVKHHIFHNIENPNCTILMVGYCADGTLGEKLIKKPSQIKIFGELLNVNARIETLSSMSAHADHFEIIDFLSNQNKEKLKSIFLVHGELKRQERLKNGLIENGFNHIEIPILEQEFKL